jgi:hypothetical protein
MYLHGIVKLFLSWLQFLVRFILGYMESLFQSPLYRIHVYGHNPFLRSASLYLSNC